MQLHANVESNETELLLPIKTKRYLLSIIYLLPIFFFFLSNTVSKKGRVKGVVDHDLLWEVNV